MKPVNEKLTISEAARELGYSSRSQLYNLIRRGYLNNYLWVDNNGRKYLEMNPVAPTQIIQVIERNPNLSFLLLKI